MAESSEAAVPLDGAGRLVRWPAKATVKRAALVYLAGKFEPGRDYAQAEVNALIGSWHAFGDFALLRRELILAGLLERTPDCRRYWRPRPEQAGVPAGA